MPALSGWPSGASAIRRGPRPDGADGLTLDVTGACHLLGGEEALLDDLIARLSAFGLTARAAMAATTGAAWALARHARTNRTIVPDGEEGRYLAPLSVRGLRLGETEVLLLERLGLKTMGQLFHMPRETLRARLGARMLRRLDQALGAEAEPVSPHLPETLYASRLTFPEPVTSMESLTHVAELLANQVAGQLRQDGKGARYYTLTFYDTQGDAFDVSITLARPSYRPVHVLRLFREKFASHESRFDDTLAFDAATLYATRVEPLVTLQSSLTGEDVSSVEQQERLTNLIDCLVARLGLGAVTRFDFPESHIPERASLDLPVLRKTSSRPQLGGRRPLLVLPRAEPLRVLAEVPDYPPRRFTWRGLDYRVVKAEGPERIAPEWWQTDDDDSCPRDYYAVEDESGRRFWLYREGQYQSECMPRWYLQGMFA